MSVERPRVTIGVPVYNGENYLEETIASLLAQSYADFELIIADNASTDGTQAICQSFAAQDARIRYVRNAHNVGAAPNFNQLVDLARGNYFRWNAHDDPVAPTHLARCVKALETDPDAVVAFPRTILIDGNGRILEYHDDRYHLRADTAHERLREFFGLSLWCHPVFGLLRTDMLRRTGRIGSYLSSDRVLLGELALWGKSHEVPEHLAYRRLHAGISVWAQQTPEDLLEWFDPAASRRFFHGRRKLFVEYVRAIWRAPLSRSERVACQREVMSYYLRTTGKLQRWRKKREGETETAVQHAETT